MDDQKPTSIPYKHRSHEAYQHNISPRLEGVVKNIGTRPVRKPKQYKARPSLPEWLKRAQETVRSL